MTVTISPNHYNQVPDAVFRDARSILDVGCMSGLNALLSRHRNDFLRCEEQGNYLGVDIQKQTNHFLSPILKADIVSADIGRRFHLILALHVLEHIPFEKWDALFTKLRALLMPGGRLVIGTPYDEHEGYALDPGHVCFRIRENTLRAFLPAAKVLKRPTKYLHFRNHEAGESLPYAILRFVYRIVTHHPYRYKLLGNCELIAILQKAPEAES